jgi:hypothetical protein
MPATAKLGYRMGTYYTLTANHPKTGSPEIPSEQGKITGNFENLRLMRHLPTYHRPSGVLSTFGCFLRLFFGPQGEVKPLMLRRALLHRLGRRGISGS